MVTFHIEDSGDRSVGIEPGYSKVETFVGTREDLEDVRGVLEECFSDLHGFSVSVMTDEEREEMSRAEEEEGW